jgi:hypothetical protein
VRVTSLTSTTPRRVVISTRRPALVATTSYVLVASPASITISTLSPFMATSSNAYSNYTRINRPSNLCEPADYLERLGYFTRL